MRNYFKRLGRAIRGTNYPDDHDYWYQPFGTLGTDIVVNNYTSMTFSAVYAGINIIAGTLASLPLHLYRTEGDKKVLAREHPNFDLLSKRANDEMSPMTLREVMGNHLLGWGNSYNQIERSSGYSYRIHGVWPIEPDRITIKRRATGRHELQYFVSMKSGPPREIPKEDMLHIVGLSFNGILGYSVLAMARKSISLGLSMEEFGERFFSAGTHPGMIATHPHKLDPETHENLKKSLTTAVGGLGKSHKLLVLEEGLKVENISIPPEECQFLSSRVFSIDEIARWLNIPAFLLNQNKYSTYSNISELFISFGVNTIRPWCVRLESAYNMQLLTEEDRRNGYEFKYNISGLLRGDPQKRSEYYKIMIASGIMTQNECRKLEELDPIDGGDVLRVPMNMVEI